MIKQRKVKTEYCLLILAYTFIFVFMPSLHCHIQYLALGPHCFHCHGHIELPSQTENDVCDFCPVINFNTVSVPVLPEEISVFFILSDKIYAETVLYSFDFEEKKTARAPPYLILIQKS